MDNLEERLALRDQRARDLQQKSPGHWFPRDRIKDVVQTWIEAFKKDNDADSACFGRGEVGSAGPLDVLHFRSGVSKRVINSIITDKEPRFVKSHRYLEVHGQELFVSIGIVDRLFIGMDCLHLFHLPPEEGGFSDVYFHPSVIDAPYEDIAA